MNVVKEKAYAKINLYLDVTEKREDGFHGIESVMHAVTLCDQLTVSFAPAKQTRVELFVKNAPYIPSDERNLAVKAAKLYCSYCGINGYIRILLEKNVPVCAGLGGGSSDAAAVLRALNRIFKYPLSTKILLKLAAEIGSDVPFCVMGKTAFCDGRGESVSPIPFSGSFVFVVGIAKERISTPIAYANLDEAFSNFDHTVPFGHLEEKNKILFALRNNLPLDCLYNIFETAVFPICKGAASIKTLMLQKGAIAAALSGSGPAVYGIFPDSETASLCKEFLCKSGFSAFVCYSATSF